MIAASCSLARMQAHPTAKLKVSRYTHLIAVSGGGLLYNGRSGAVLELHGHACRSARGLIEDLREGRRPRMSSLRRELLEHLEVGGFLVEKSKNEFDILVQQYDESRARSQFLLTIVPTFGCNLGCGYCFVGKKRGLMSDGHRVELIRFVEKRLRIGNIPSMHVDWFGGEPLLAPDVIEELSSAFIALCDEVDIPYRAQVISNGTAISRDVVRMLEKARVDRIQISIDGPREVHDVRRPYKAGGGRSSFDSIIEKLPLVVGKFLIRLRINVDRENLSQVWPLLDIFGERGWLGPETRFFPYLERVSPFTEASSHVESVVCPMDDFMETQFRWMEELKQRGVPVIEQGLYRFPAPRSYTCGAVGKNGFLITSEGEIHKCGLEIDNSAEAIGILGEELDPGNENLARFENYSPFEDPMCRECEFLPTCLGGCPRSRLKNRENAIRDNCTYYKKYELQILKTHLGRGQKSPPSTS